MRLLNLPIDKAASRAMNRASATPVAWNCDAGMHEPMFLMRIWACRNCGAPLSLRIRRVA